MFSNYTLAEDEPWSVPAGGYVRNPTCWARDLNFTGIGLLRGDGGHWYAGTLISPRHFVIANHAFDGIGIHDDEIHFIRSDGSAYTATVENWQRVFNTPSDDIAIGYLDSVDVPSDVLYYKVVPRDFSDTLTNGGESDDLSGLIIPEVDGLYGKPAVNLDQEFNVGIGRIWKIQPGMSVAQESGLYPGRSEYWLGPTFPTGDSSFPSFLLVESGELLLLGCIKACCYTATFLSLNGEPPPFKNHFTEINAVMAALDTDGTGYQLTEYQFADLIGSVPAAEACTA